MPLFSASFLPSISTNVEAQDDCVGGNCQVDIGFTDTAYGCVNHADLNFIGRKFGQSVNQSFLRALNVGLDNQRQGLLAFRILTKKTAEFVIDLASSLTSRYLP